MDVICAQCGEPWDFYGIEQGDFEKEDIEPFFRGDYCPSCHNDPDCRTGQFLDQHFESLLEAADFGPRWPVVPDQTGHPFRSKVATRFGRMPATF